MVKFSRRKALGLCAVSAVVAHDAFAAATAIDESGFETIGGIDQWIAIRGADIHNPAIVFLHGGPAEAQSPFLQEFQPWESSFTVVNWDQRGAGKTFGRNGPTTPEMTVERMAADAVEVAQLVCRRLSKRKVVLVCHSWGAVLGLHAIKQRPDLFHAYVGTGQPITWALSLKGQEAWARRQATELNDQATLKRLDDAAALPITDWRRMTDANKYRMSPADTEYLALQRAFISQPHGATGEVADWIGGGNFAISKLGAPIFDFDARALGLEMKIPFFVIQGRDDHVVSFDAARDFVRDVRAPSKAFIPIDGGHFALFTDPSEFVGALQRYVRPVAR